MSEDSWIRGYSPSVGITERIMVPLTKELAKELVDSRVVENQIEPIMVPITKDQARKLLKQMNAALLHGSKSAESIAKAKEVIFAKWLDLK